jgi:AraC-like DNA-binding protein
MNAGKGRQQRLFAEGEFPVVARASTGRMTDVPRSLCHPEIEFHLLLHGRVEYFVRDTRYELNKNSVIFIHENDLHQRVNNPDSSVKVMDLIFLPSILRNRDSSAQALEQLRDFHHIVLNDKEAVQAEFILQSLVDEVAHHNLGWQDIVVNLIEFFLVLLHRNAREGNAQPASGGGGDQIQTVLRYLEARFADKISMNEVAEHFCLAYSTFSRKFKRYVGLGFREYLIQRRVLEARRLLEGTDLKIASVALECGFDTLSAFNYHFHRLTGTIPSNYRKMVAQSRSSSDIMR